MDIREYITKCYLDILYKEPDVDGLEGYLEKIRNKEISQEQLPLILRESKDFKRIMKNDGKILKKRKKRINNMRKIRKVRYGNTSVSYNGFLAFGGHSFGQDFVPVVKDIFVKVPRICEFCCGAGHIGFSLLANGLCESLCLIDINPEAVKMCKKTIEENKLEDRVSVYLSDGLSNIPPSEKWDLVVSNPPNANHLWEKNKGTMTAARYLRVVDPNWNIHRQFYADVGKFLKPKGSVLFVENIEANMPWFHSEMIIKNGLELVDIFWHKKFYSLRDTYFLKFKSKKINKKIRILKEFLKPSPYIFYLVLSRKTDGNLRKI